MGGLQVFARLNFTKCKRKQIPYGKVGLLALCHTWGKQLQVMLGGEGTGLTTFFQFLEDLIYGVRETLTVGSHQDSYFKCKGIFQWSLRRKPEGGFWGKLPWYDWEKAGRKWREGQRPMCQDTISMRDFIEVTEPAPNQPPPLYVILNCQRN